MTWNPFRSSRTRKTPRYSKTYLPRIECLEERRLLSPTFTLRHLVDNPSPAVHDLFGYAVAARGNKVLVGSKQDSTDGYHSGQGAASI